MARIEYKSGAYYEGDVKEVYTKDPVYWWKRHAHQVRHGYGVYQWNVSYSDDRYEGYWADDERHGPGKFIRQGRNSAGDMCKSVEEGYWVHGKKHGKFKITEYLNDKLDATWEINYNNDTVVDGTYTRKYVNGRVQHITYKNGEIVGW